ncbi:N-acetylmuramoyl-L-alanine amidase [Paenibacillus azoreducens]|uniref:MurNAc-LAA domain-containing protein n=1 Tax=Paenibacillus azoreducens TaxID=116718 RepID=A0A919YB45_9BACL|nr:N-acetylmuramoyl-L-alanine amidase [Paenibacillus azoreducens]GIO47957.1 hypothetical protein J34TS1_27220 [Paenibacillus azoreducens]
MKKVWIDAGHGGKDSGAVGNGVKEKDIVLTVSLAIKRKLESDYEGVQVLLTRSTDVFLELKDRTNKANAAGADLLVSIHCNAGGGSGGFESYTYNGTNNAATTALQNELHTEIMSRLKQYRVIDRGQKKKNLHMCRESRMPAVLTENLFVDVAADAARLKRLEVIEALVSGHVAGIAKYLKLQKRTQQLPASGTINILGPATATVDQAKEWARTNKAPAEFVELAKLYWELAPERGGVDPAIAYVQFGHETGYMYRDGRSAAGIDASYHNPCGLKITTGGGDYQASAHKRFKDWREGITAHLDHLALYAGAAGYPKKETPDPRHFKYLRGTAKTVDALGAKWAPSSSYGTRLVTEIVKLRGSKGAEKTETGNNGEEATIELNGKKICSGVFVNGLVTAPVRAVADALGAKVGWDGKHATVNGKQIIGSQLKGDVTYAPVREVVEAADGNVVDWIGKVRKVIIQK